MSALGHKQTSRDVRVTSALPPIADTRRMSWHVRFVPEADVTSSTTRWPTTEAFRMLVAQGLHFAERFHGRPLVFPIAYKALAFTVLLMGAYVIEETAMGMWHGSSAA
jgi:hypothetical protein